MAKRKLCAAMYVCALPAAWVALAAGPTASAGSIPVENHSFESPQSILLGGVYPEADGWTETGPIDGEPPDFPGFEVPPGGPFTLDTGVFFNSPVVTNPTPPPDFLENPSFVVNAEGDQLAYLFARDDADIAFRQTLAAVYQPGFDYTLTVAIGQSFFLPPINAEGGTPEMAIRLVYENDEQELEVVAEQSIAATQVGDGTMVFDFSASTGELPAEHAALGRDVTLWIGPTLGTSGVWILDNVRVSFIPEFLLGDLSRDGVLDAFDVAPFELALADRAAYEAAYPESDPDALGDFSGDGVLDAFDVSGFETALAGQQTFVPEPASALLAGLGMTALLARRRSRSTRSTPRA